MKVAISSWLTCLLALWLGPVFAQGRAEVMIKNADVDKDGRISRREWRGPPPRFDQFDTDSDGYLTLDEIKAGLAGADAAVRDTGPAAPAQSRSCPYQAVVSPETLWKIESFAPDCVFAGTTLFADNTAAAAPRIVEVDMKGGIVWHYALASEFRGGVRRQVQIMDVERLANGNTLFVVRGWGIVEVDRDGRVVWKHADPDASHDADRLPSGNTIYVRAWVAKGQDHLREVTPEGRVVRSWNGLQAYDRKPFATIEHEGWIHVNAVQPMANGDAFLSLRNFGILARVAPNGQIVQEVPLPLGRTSIDAYDFADKTQPTMPHDPEFREDGTVSVCLTSKNVLLVFNASTRQRLWMHSYEGQGPQLPRDINTLPNGNRLVVTHRFIEELAPSGQTVWRLLVPSIQQMEPGTARPEYLFKAQRIGSDGSIHGN